MAYRPPKEVADHLFFRNENDKSDVCYLNRWRRSHTKDVDELYSAVDGSTRKCSLRQIVFAHYEPEKRCLRILENLGDPHYHPKHYNRVRNYLINQAIIYGLRYEEVEHL